MTRVLACGGLTIDWLQTSEGRIGPSLGGNAAYSAVGAWLAGADAEVVAVVGDDYPAELVEELSAAGIGTSWIRVDHGPSFRVLLDESGPRRTISYLHGSGRNDRLDPLPSQLPVPQRGDAMHVCAIPAASQRALLAAARTRGELVTLDTVIIEGEIEPDTKALLDLARTATVFMPSRDELEHHWPGGVEAALDHLAAAGCARVVVKLGAEGSIGREAGASIRVPAVATEVVDPIGAGDAYCGAACARLAMGESLRSAMAWGAAAASVIIEGHGAARALTPANKNTVAERASSLRTEPTTA